METWDAVPARRNVRQHTDQPIALVGAEPPDQLYRGWLQYDFGQATAHMMLTAADRPLGPLLRPARRPFDEVVHWDRW